MEDAFRRQWVAALVASSWWKFLSLTRDLTDSNRAVNGASAIDVPKSALSSQTRALWMTQTVKVHSDCVRHLWWYITVHSKVEFSEYYLYFSSSIIQLSKITDNENDSEDDEYQYYKIIAIRITVNFPFNICFSLTVLERTTGLLLSDSCYGTIFLHQPLRLAPIIQSLKSLKTRLFSLACDLWRCDALLISIYKFSVYCILHWSVVCMRAFFMW